MTNNQRQRIAMLIVEWLNTDARLRAMVQAGLTNQSGSVSSQEDTDALIKRAQDWSGKVDDFCMEVLGISEMRVLNALIRAGILPVEVVTMSVVELREIKQIGFQSAALINDARLSWKPKQ